MKIKRREKGNTNSSNQLVLKRPHFSLSPPRLAGGDFQACSRFAHSTIPEEKWGLLVV